MVPALLHTSDLSRCGCSYTTTLKAEEHKHNLLFPPFEFLSPFSLEYHHFIFHDLVYNSLRTFVAKLDVVLIIIGLFSAQLRDKTRDQRPRVRTNWWWTTTTTLNSPPNTPSQHHTRQLANTTYDLHTPIMASSNQNAILEISDTPNIPIERSEAIPIEQPTKLKGRAKLLHSLQRISSSQSLTQLGRKRASSNPYNGRGALSCVSLASPVSPRVFDNSYGSSSSGVGFSTAPSTPGVDTPFLEGRQMGPRKVEMGSSPLASPTSALPLDMRPMSRSGLSSFPEHPDLPEIQEDYFSLPLPITKRPAKRVNFNFWNDLPHEIALTIFSYLKPKQIVRISRVSKDFQKLSFDGQLWTSFNATEFYREISAESLAKILVAAGPFVKDLNLRGCIQVEYYKKTEVVAKACKNLMSATLEGCRNFQRSTLHLLLRSNERLENLNLTGLNMVTNGSCKIIAEHCPSLEVLNVSWCGRLDARGVRKIIESCPKLRDLRAGEVTGFASHEIAQVIFETNALEKLVLPGCEDITDEALKIMITGTDPEIDILTDLPIVPVRNLRHLDLSRCTLLTSKGIKCLTGQVPSLTALQLSGCPILTDDALSTLLPTTPHLTHLDLEELSELTDALLIETLSKAPCAPILQHISLSYCEKLGDPGLLPLIRACTSLSSAMLDNTRISDLTLIEASTTLRTRPHLTPSNSQPPSRHRPRYRPRPKIGLDLTVYDCQNVTWTGIREILFRNAEIPPSQYPPASQYPPPSQFPSPSQPNSNPKPPYEQKEIIALRCFYNWQPVVSEHNRRVLRGDLEAARRLEKKWGRYMMFNEEVGAGGGRRMRRRARRARVGYVDEEGGGGGGGRVGGVFGGGGRNAGRDVGRGNGGGEEDDDDDDVDDGGWNGGTGWEDGGGVGAQNGWPAPGGRRARAAARGTSCSIM